MRDDGDYNTSEGSDNLGQSWMPTSFLRKHVRGFLRSKFSPSASLESSPDEDDLPTPSNEAATFLSQCYLAGIDGRRIDFPEVYCGKTGLDIPCIQLEHFDDAVFATFTGPDGGLTQVGEVRRQPMVQMANLDDEMSLSMDGMTDSEQEEGNSDEEEDLEMPISAPLKREKARSTALLGSCSSLIGPNGHISSGPGKGADRFDWKRGDEKRAFGVSVSLYEKNPLTGVHAGEPIADVWGLVARNNNGVLALADGVNWGEGARLAARCAIRGAIDHMNQQIERDTMNNSAEVFHELLAAFHSAHSLILQEGGLLTTLCVAVVVPAKHGNSWILCVCNVGDSLCFVYNRNYGVREVTLGSHDIDQMRDMRDAGGALGPVDGRNPQLHNLTCSMTFVEEGDMVFITSDGVSDNFDPVVGKFCVIKKTEHENKENSHLPPRQTARKLSVTTKDSPSREFARNRACAASLPCVDAASRHELMLVRMRDIIANGTEPPREESVRLSPRAEPLFPPVTAALLCKRLIQFATQLSTAKRRTLENPELYSKKEKMTKAEQRAIRRAVREKIIDMPGKLDHASVVCYRVGRREAEQNGTGESVRGEVIPRDVGDNISENVVVEASFENFARIDRASCCNTLPQRGGERVSASLTVNLLSQPAESTEQHDDYSHAMSDLVDPKSPTGERPLSPYEQLPLAIDIDVPNKRKKHGRGSAGRHTLGVDVQWLKKKFVSKKEEAPLAEESITEQVTSSSGGDRLSITSRIRGLLGSSRNISSSRQDNSQLDAGTSGRPNRPAALHVTTSSRQ